MTIFANTVLKWMLGLATPVLGLLGSKLFLLLWLLSLLCEMRSHKSFANVFRVLCLGFLFPFHDNSTQTGTSWAEEINELFRNVKITIDIPIASFLQVWRCHLKTTTLLISKRVGLSEIEYVIKFGTKGTFVTTWNLTSGNSDMILDCQMASLKWKSNLGPSYP